METFKIFNNTTITFSLMDRVRIVLGKEVKVSVVIHAEKEVIVFDEKTEHSVYVHPIIKPKPVSIQGSI